VAALFDDGEVVGGGDRLALLVSSGARDLSI